MTRAIHYHQIENMTMGESVTHNDPFAVLALHVIRVATIDRDIEWFASEEYDFWLGYLQCVGVIPHTHRPIPPRIRQANGRMLRRVG